MVGGRLLGHPGRRVHLDDLGAGGRRASTSTGSSRCSTAPTSGASPRSSAPRRTRCRRGWPASTRRSPASAAPGERIPWGARQEVDFTHPAFRFHAERVIRAVVGRYADHPAVIGFQVDNEPGLELLHNRGVFESFVDHLRHTYGDVETLNREWGLVYWSHRLSTWDDLWTPDGNSAPAVRPRVAPLPGAADQRVHRLAGRHRARVRPRPTSSSPPASPTRARRSTTPALTGAARRHRGQPLLRHAGRPRAALDARARRRAGRRRAPGACSRARTGCTPPSRRRSSSPRRTPARSAGRRPTSPRTTGSGGRSPGRWSPAARR